MISEQAERIAKQAEEHERFINKVSVNFSRFHYDVIMLIHHIIPATARRSYNQGSGREF